MFLGLPHFISFSLRYFFNSFRELHACGLYNQNRVIVAGGFLSGSELDTVEIFSATSHTWSAAGTNLPKALASATIYQQSMDFYLLGGYDGTSAQDTIYLYNGSQWVESPTKLKEPLEGHCVTLWVDGN